MACRSIVNQNYWPQVTIRTREYATSTMQKFKRFVPTADLDHVDNRNIKHRVLKGDLVPVYVALGMIAMSVSFGLYTVKQQLFHAPNVRVNKKLRETLLEVEDPDAVVEESSRFINKSLFRKIAQVQEKFAYRQGAETLKNVGVHSNQH